MFLMIPLPAVATVCAGKTKSFLSLRVTAWWEDGSHGSWTLDFIYFFPLLAERISLPIPVPRKRLPRPYPRPQTVPDMPPQPPVPRPRSKLTEVATLALFGVTYPVVQFSCSLHIFSCMWSQESIIFLA